MKEFRCVQCSEKTQGTYSEGGVLFALCDQCYHSAYEDFGAEKPLKIQIKTHQERKNLKEGGIRQ